MIDRIFELLDDWRKLPKYQLERRADLFFGLYLERIVERCLEVSPTAVIPEFPLMKGLYDANCAPKERHRSSNIDYLVVCEEQRKVLLVELKTDMGSRNDPQFDRMARCSKMPVQTLVDGVLQIKDKSDGSKSKYDHLLGKLEAIGWLRKGNAKYESVAEDYAVEIVYIQPRKFLSDGRHEITFEQIAGLLGELNGDELAKRFARSLRKWSDDPV